MYYHAVWKLGKFEVWTSCLSCSPKIERPALDPLTRPVFLWLNNPIRDASCTGYCRNDMFWENVMFWGWFGKCVEVAWELLGEGIGAGPFLGSLGPAEQSQGPWRPLSKEMIPHSDAFLGSLMYFFLLREMLLVLELLLVGSLLLKGSMFCVLQLQASPTGGIPLGP